MNEEASSQASHAFYIEAVQRGIEEHDVRVAEVRVGMARDGRREATLALRPDGEAFVGQVPEEASAAWDEDNGWSVLVRHGSLVNQVYKGPGGAARSGGCGGLGGGVAGSPGADAEL